jgi:hypothetical protein
MVGGEERPLEDLDLVGVVLQRRRDRLREGGALTPGERQRRG